MTSLTATLRKALDERHANPLDQIQFTPKQIEYISVAARSDESALRAANKCGKSIVAGAVAVALCRSVRSLGGVALPVLRTPATGWVLTRTYKQQVEGTQAAVEHALGNWPHEIAWQDRKEGTWSTVWIKPDGWKDPDPQSWAKLSFVSQQNSKNDADVAKGARLDFVWFDEPGYPAVVRELRKAGRPGWPFRILHTFTPIRRNEWLDLREDIEAPGSHIVEVTAGLDDAIFLRPEERAKQVQFYKRDPHRLARVTGAYCDVAGGGLFEHDMDTVLAAMQNCEPGQMHAVANATRNGKTILYPQPHPGGAIEVWGWPEDDDIGIVVVDPASGVRDPDVSDARQSRNPAGVILGSVKQRKVLARCVAYINSHEMGQIARALANRCKKSLVVVETNGGWGETCIHAFRESEAGSSSGLYYERNPKTGDPATEPGWNQTSTRRGELIAALQRAVAESGITIPSRSMWENLLQVRLNQNERWDQGDGKGPHGEDMIMAGIFCAVLEGGDYFRAGEPVKFAPPSTRAAPRPLPALRR